MRPLHQKHVLSPLARIEQASWGLDRLAALDQSRKQLLFLNDISFWSLPQVRQNEAAADSSKKWMIVMSGMHVVAILVRTALPG